MASSTSLTSSPTTGFVGWLCFAALLLKQLRKHRPSELIAFRLRRRAIDAPGRHRDRRQRTLGNHFVRRELRFRFWAIAGCDRMPFLCQVRSPGVPAHELAR